MMIPSHLKFGYSINSWVWFIALILIIKSGLLSKTIDKHSQFLIDNGIVLYLIMLSIILNIILDIILFVLWIREIKNTK